MQQQSLSIHACLEDYETSISALFDAIAASSVREESPFDLDEAINRVIARDSSLSDALQEGTAHPQNGSVEN